MPTKDKSWQTVYTATAGQLSATFGSSSGTQVSIPLRGAIGIEVLLYSKTLAAGIFLLVTPKLVDSDSQAAYPQRRDGAVIRQKMNTAGRQTAAFWFNAEQREGATDGSVTIEPWLSATDATAACVVKVKRIYPHR